MGFFSRLVDKIDSKIDQPADTTVLTARHNSGSEAMIESESGEEAAAAGRRVRRERDRRRRRWINGG